MLCVQGLLQLFRLPLCILLIDTDGMILSKIQHEISVTVARRNFATQIFLPKADSKSPLEMRVTLAWQCPAHWLQRECRLLNCFRSTRRLKIE